VPAGHPSGHRGSPHDLVRVLRAEGIRDRRVLAAFGEVGDGTLGWPEHGQVIDARLTPAYLVPLVGVDWTPSREGRGGR
jgi:hypothetical protein